MLLRFVANGFHRRSVSRRNSEKVSAPLRRCLRPRAAYLLLPAVLTGSAAADEAIGPLRSTAERPFATRGGVLMLPLAAASDGFDWPDSAELTLADGSVIEGTIAWIHPRLIPAERYWTEEPRRLGVRPIRPADDTSIPASGRSVLLARLPVNGYGSITFFRQQLNPVWLDRPASSTPRPAADGRQMLTLTTAPDLPDPASPFAYWRWVLLARRLGAQPPPSDSYGEVGRMLAEHEADLWQTGFDRLEANSPGVAGRCLHTLTATCRDDSSPTGCFAAWQIDPAQAAALLAILLDFTRDDREMADDALAWANDRDALLLWTEAGHQSEVRLALANPTREVLVARFTWLSIFDDIPIAAQLDPAELSRVAIDRPAASQPAGVGLPAPPDALSQVLLVEIGNRSRQLRFGPPVAVARPPGAFFHTLMPTLRLFEVRARLQEPPLPQRATFVHLRKRQQRWEIFFECLRPLHDALLTSAPEDEGGGQMPHEDDATQLADCPDWKQTASIEAVTLIIGPEEEQGGPSVVLTVPETGWHRLFVGSNDGTMQIHRRSYPDRWLCRIVLPDAWLFDPADPEAPLLLGAMRTHGDCDLIQTAPNPAVPWRARPTREAINLTQWDSPPPR
ncbi:MAG: hypothetical protein JSV91_08545 [Phycisphaerales bacterium]|nr:MAG: hypothetical protein JSV91_08545 [Phycisphaerales bacterium]